MPGSKPPQEPPQVTSQGPLQPSAEAAFPAGVPANNACSAPSGQCACPPAKEVLVRASDLYILMEQKKLEGSPGQDTPGKLTLLGSRVWGSELCRVTPLSSQHLERQDTSPSRRGGSQHSGVKELAPDHTANEGRGQRPSLP